MEGKSPDPAQLLHQALAQRSNHNWIVIVGRFQREVPNVSAKANYFIMPLILVLSKIKASTTDQGETPPLEETQDGFTTP